MRFPGYASEQMEGCLHAKFGDSIGDGACDGIAASRRSWPVSSRLEFVGWLQTRSEKPAFLEAWLWRRDG